VGDLAERLQLRHHSVVGLVDRLASAKLVVRAPSTRDRRQVLVALTPHGEQVLERLSSAHSTELKRVGPKLTLFLRQLRAVK
jgi:DNA-binding MarR family transcriptional regulator